MPTEKKYPLLFCSKALYAYPGIVLADLMDKEISASQANQLTAVHTNYRRQIETIEGMHRLEKVWAVLNQHGFNFDSDCGDFVSVAGLSMGCRMHLFYGAEIQLAEVVKGRAKRVPPLLLTLVAVLKGSTPTHPYSQELRRWTLVDIAEELANVFAEASAASI